MSGVLRTSKVSIVVSGVLFGLCATDADARNKKAAPKPNEPSLAEVTQKVVGELKEALEEFKQMQKDRKLSAIERAQMEALSHADARHFLADQCVRRVPVPAIYSPMRVRGNDYVAVLVDPEGDLEKRYDFTYQVPGLEEILDSLRNQVSKSKGATTYTETGHISYFNLESGQFIMTVHLQNKSKEPVSVPPDVAMKDTTSTVVTSGDGLLVQAVVPFKNLQPPEREMLTGIQNCKQYVADHIPQ